MTEPSPEAQPAAPEAPQAEQQPEQFDQERAMEKIRKANSEAENLRRRLKEVEPLADQFRQLEEASKSELQRIQEAHDAATRSAEAAAAEALRYRVALAHGVGVEDIDLLGSGSEDEITARAQRIAAMKAAAAQPAVTPPPSGRSKEQLQPGATPVQAPPADDIQARHRQYFAARYEQQSQ